MKMASITSTALLSLLLVGIAAPTYAQQEQQGAKGDSSERQQDKQKKAKPTKQPAQPQRTQRKQQQPQRAQQQPQHTQQKRQPLQHAQQPSIVRQDLWQQHRARSWQSDHRSWQQRGGYTGYRIPDRQFTGYFGVAHGFRISGLPFLVVAGYPRFQYRGFWFSLVDPWPEYWANDWYDTDDVYVNYVNDGYYLFNRRHPDVGVSIRISL